MLVAPDGEAAAAVTETERPDLIVTDWMMPVVDGVAFCRRLKAKRATSSIPVVMLTAALPPLPVESAALLWDILLRKPTPVARLIEVSGILLKTKRGSPLDEARSP
ncbi:hypothetical protein PTKU64_54090 [Paraburkholderia terrae]|uniref:Response regulatory domain-containing protein n=1 Tax=Paraburkholderia terrae TaxID=311230 RepID=A0ABN6JNL6_9BURK|nr:response regulator [Paraburkholderia terrae]BCZ81734.1 hypothetical protein PTKU64_54090 [Paraburkholderia terrae]